MKRTISVKQQDIDWGIRLDGSLCPIALAIAREFNISDEDRSRKVLVLTRQAYITDGGGELVCVLPDSARTFIKAFDYSEGDIKPFDFEVDCK